MTESGLLPDRIFYDHPWYQVVPEGYYQSIWTYQYLDDVGGLLPDIEFLIAVDHFSLLIGGAVSAGFTFYTSELSETLVLDWPPSDSWFEDWFPLKRIGIMTVLYGYLAARYVGRFLLGGCTYLATRHLTHFVWINLLRTHGSQCQGMSLRSLWASGAIYSFVWSSFYTPHSVAWNIVSGCWIGLGMGMLELFWSGVCEACAVAPNLNFL